MRYKEYSRAEERREGEETMLKKYRCMTWRETIMGSKLELVKRVTEGRSTGEIISLQGSF